MACIAACSAGADVRKEYWKQRFSKELPAGTSVSAVNAFFKQAGLEHSYSKDSKTVYAIERDVSGGFIVSYGVEIRCTITANETLQYCSADVYGDGP
jgi:hypothetical protein